jgi:hypothetical protein
MRSLGTAIRTARRADYSLRRQQSGMYRRVRAGGKKALPRTPATHRRSAQERAGKPRPDHLPECFSSSLNTPTSTMLTTVTISAPRKEATKSA